jgi:hypothetical protein
MKVSRFMPGVFLTLGAVFLMAGLFPRLRGESFNTGFFAPGITFFVIGGAMRRRRRSEEERRETAGGR